MNVQCFILLNLGLLTAAMGVPVWDILDEAQERSFLPIRSMLRDGVEYNLRYKENTEDGPENRRRLNGYSNPYNLSYTHGEKSILLVRYKVEAIDYTGWLPDSEINDIFTKLSEYVHHQSYGKVTLKAPTVVPGFVEITDGNFYEVADRCREKANDLGYNHQDYDFELYWKRVTSGGVGGSATPGGKVQTFKYTGSGDLPFFKSKIVPHEFMHNFGVGHAWAKGQTYGDNYDILGGGTLNSDYREAHVSLPTKHRFGWVTDREVKFVQKSDATSNEVFVDIKPFDSDTAISDLGDNQFLGVKLETRYKSGALRCPPGVYNWCPSWTNGNAWFDNNPADKDIFLYLSYRGFYDDTKDGISLHLAKFKSDGWVDATTFLDVRGISTSQTDAVLRVGETYVFEGNTQFSIVIKLVSLADETMRVSVQYTNGRSLASNYEVTNAARLCSQTLSCGQPVSISTDSAMAITKMGEYHHTQSVVSLCAQNIPGVKTYSYTDFPIAQAMYSSNALISAVGELTDVCKPTPYPKSFKVTGTGNWWADGGDYTFQDLGYYEYNFATNKMEFKAGKYPHYVFKGHTWEAHVAMFHCTFWYCKKPSYQASGNQASDVWQYVLSYNGFSNYGYNCVTNIVYEDSIDPTALPGLKWLKCKGRHEMKEEATVTMTLLGAGDKLNVGQHEKSIGWLVTTFDLGMVSGASTLNLTSTGCEILECGESTYADLPPQSSSSSHCKKCHECGQGYESIPNYNGSKACYFPENEGLRVTFVDAESKYDSSGFYFKTGTFNGALVYESNTTVAATGRKRLLRHTGVGKGWKFTETYNVGRAGREGGYGDDTYTFIDCNVNKVIYPQTFGAVPTTATKECSPDGKHVWIANSVYTSSPAFKGKVLIEELGNPASSGSVATESNATSGGCSCGKHSFAGDAATCSDPEALKENKCTWGPRGCEDAEPNVTGKFMGPVSENVCDTALAGELCDAVNCTTGYAGGSIRCNVGTGQYDVTACTPNYACDDDEPGLFNRNMEPIIANGCDGTLAGNPCSHVCKPGYNSGSIVCNGGTGSYDVTGCVGIPQHCADNEPDVTGKFMNSVAGNACDNTIVDAQCASFSCQPGYTGGSITCTGDGSFVVTKCAGTAACNDAEPDVSGKLMETLSPNQCDNTIAGEDCLSFACRSGHRQGSITCNGASGQYDVIPCLPVEGFCDAAEPNLGGAHMDSVSADGCDGTDAGAQCDVSCESGYSGGSVTCSGETGLYIVEGCVESVGHCDAVEPSISESNHMMEMNPNHCDGTIANGQCAHTCKPGYEGGSVTCTSSTGQYDVSACTPIDGFCDNIVPLVAGKNMLDTLNSTSCKGTQVGDSCSGYRCVPGYSGGSIVCLAENGNAVFRVGPCTAAAVCDDAEPTVRANNMKTMAPNQCDGTVTDSHCDHVCIDNYHGGSITCDGATEKYVLVPCLRSAGLCDGQDTDASGMNMDILSSACDGTAAGDECENFKCHDGYVGGSIMCDLDSAQFKIVPCDVKPVENPQKTVRQTITLTGVTRAQVQNKLTAIKQEIAAILGISHTDITVTSVLSSYRRRSLMALASVQLNYQINVKDFREAIIMETKMKDPDFADKCNGAIAKELGIDPSQITVLSSSPETVAFVAVSEDPGGINREGKLVDAIYVIVGIAGLFLLALIGGIYFCKPLKQAKDTTLEEIEMSVGIENVSVAHFGTENVSVALVKANSDVENDGASLLQSTGQMKVPAKSQGPGYGEDVELGKSKSEMGRGDNTARQIKTGVAFL